MCTDAGRVMCSVSRMMRLTLEHAQACQLGLQAGWLESLGFVQPDVWAWRHELSHTGVGAPECFATGLERHLGAGEGRGEPTPPLQRCASTHSLWGGWGA